jgi:predicted ATPase/DNA-binding SARP family transcriptional activator
MRFEILGELRAFRGETPVELGGALPRRLAAALLVDAPGAVQQDTLVERLWGSRPPATATTALQVHVSRLRRALAPDYERGDQSILRTVSAGYALEIDRGDVDADRFEGLVRDADDVAATDPERALRTIESARALWRDRPWGALADEPWLRADVARIEDLRRWADELWADVQLELGRHELIVDALATAVQVEPLRERRWEQLILALYRCGRQAESLRAFQDARCVLTEELGIEPSRSLRALEQAVLVQDPGLDATFRSVPERPRDNLPSPLTQLVGRTDEVQTTRKRLETSRLVTITGSGGCGKTRLAIAVAEELIDLYEDDVWFVDLAAAPSAELVVPQIASDLGLRDSSELGAARPLEHVHRYLRDRHLLLVLDNCEHVVAEVATIVGSLLTSCRRLRVLATSRASIGVVGEMVEVLTPLDTPAADATLEDIATSSAVQLFLQRAEDTGASCDRLGDVADLCRFLEGVPLAIELAANWVETLTPSEILDRLDRRLALVAADDRLPDRQRGLRAVIEWSHTLLTDTERVAFRRLSVFPAGFTLAGAEAVAADSHMGADTVVGAVARLVSSSLVRTDHRTLPARYRMLESVREFASEQLEHSHEEGGVRARQLDYFVGLARNVRRDEFFGPPVYETMATLDSEHDNVRDALERLLMAGDGERALALAGAMGTYWFERGYIAEGQRYITRALELTAGSESVNRALALVALAEAVSHFEDIARRLEELREATKILREKGSDRHLLFALSLLTMALGMRGYRSEAAASRAEQKEIVTGLDDPWLYTSGSMFESLALVGDGDPIAGRDGLLRCAREFLELGDEIFAARVLMYSGIVSQLAGDFTAARSELGRSIELARQSGIRGTQAHAELTLAQVAMHLGDQDAASLFRDCKVTFETIGDVRCIAICDRSLGSLALDAGRLDEAADLLGQSVAGLATRDLPALAVTIADLATIHHRRSENLRAARFAAAALALAQRPGMPLSAAERARVHAAATEVDASGAEVPMRDGEVDLDALLEVAREPGAEDAWHVA